MVAAVVEAVAAVAEGDETLAGDAGAAVAVEAVPVEGKLISRVNSQPLAG